MTGNLEDLVGPTRRDLQQFLEQVGVLTLAAIVTEHGLTRADALAALHKIVKDRAVPPPWAQLSRELGDSEPLLGRWVLAQAAFRSLDQVPGLPVVSEVRSMMLRTFRLIAEPGPISETRFLMASRGFREFAQIVLLQRFVAGQLHWTHSGVPRSWLIKMNWRDAVRVMRAVYRMGGWSPCFEPHLPDTVSPFLIESEFRRCHLRMAQSMEMQPTIRGLMGASWYFSDETVLIDPHLDWMRRFYLDNGGILGHLGLAGPDSGFQQGSSKRRELYEGGLYRPRIAYIVWPRDAVLGWAHTRA